MAVRRQKKIKSLDKAELSRQKILNAYLRQKLLRQKRQTIMAVPPSLQLQARIDELSGGGKCCNPPNKQDPYTKFLKSNKTLDEKIDRGLKSCPTALIAQLEDDVDDEVNPKAKRSFSDADENKSKDCHYSEHFSAIQGPDFDILPLETQHEILFEMQESRKMNSWGKFDMMPKDPQRFSSFQMDRLVKRRALQKKIQSVQQEMGQKHIHVQNLDDLLKFDYGDFENKKTQIAVSKNDGFALMKSQATDKEKIQSQESKPGTSRQVITIDDFLHGSSSDSDSSTKGKSKPTDNSSSKKIVGQNVNNERSEEEDLKHAIALSLLDVGTVEIIGNSFENINRGPVKENQAFSLETAATLQTATEMGSKEDDKEFPIFQMSHCAKFLDTVGFRLPQPLPSNENYENFLTENNNSGNLVNTCIKPIDDDEGTNNSTSESDEDFEEVVDETSEETQCPSTGSPDTVTTIDLTDLRGSAFSRGEDIFADIFLVDKEHHSHAPVELNKNVNKKTHDPILSSDDLEVESKWDLKSESGSDIEADLIEIVMKESVELTSTDCTISSSSNQDEASEKLPSTANKDFLNYKHADGQLRMITTNYLQTQVRNIIFCTWKFFQHSRAVMGF